MAIVGQQLENGVRVVAERPRDGGPPWHYEGQALAKDVAFHISARLDADGTLSVELHPDPPAGLADKVRLIFRSAWRHAREDETVPPRRIGRWRAER